MQYLRWLSRTLQGDLGVSLEFKEPVLGLVLTRVKNTLILTTASMVISALDCTLEMGAW